jgi:hypothetical protein
MSTLVLFDPVEVVGLAVMVVILLIVMRTERRR